MLDSMGKARHVLLIAEIANVHVEGSTGLVCVRVMNQQSLELIVELDDSVVSVIEGWLLQAVCQHGGWCKGWARGRLRHI
jgi:hypothetical protein